MKLIDGNELLEKVNTIKYLRKIKARQIVDDCKEIEAIPIEYILNHYEVNNIEQNKALDELIESWRKENEW